MDQERVQQLRDKVGALQEKGYHVGISEQALADLERFHNVDAVSEMERAIDNQVQLEDLVGSGVKFEDAIEQVGW